MTWAMAGAHSVCGGAAHAAGAVGWVVSRVR